MPEETNSDNDRADMSRIREIALVGDRYREEHEYPYFGNTLTLSLKPVKEKELIPYQTLLMEKMGMDLDDAEEEMEETKPGDLDAEFLYIMGEIALLGIDRSKADARGEDEEGLREVLAVGELENEIGFVGGVTLEIAQDVINISQNSEDAESFRG